MAESRWADHDRFKKEYGFPPGRREIATKDLEEKYVKNRPLGVGVGGLNEGIHLVQNKENGRKYVQKEIDAGSPQLLRELLLLQALDHPNIIRYVDAFIDKSQWHHHRASVYLEYCSFKSAQDLLDKYHKHNRNRPESHHAYVPEHFIWHIFRSLASALQYLHFGIRPDDKRSPEELDPLVKAPQYCQEVWPIILHRDIKPDNIFFRKCQPRSGFTIEPWKLLRIFPRQRKVPGIFSQPPKVFLADFGLALTYNDPDWNVDRSYIGTLHWMPPELPEAFVHSDVWAVGAIILALCRQMPEGVVKPPPVGWTAGSEAWSKHPDARKGIRDHGVGKHYSPELNNVVHECLRFNRRNRPLAFKLLAMINEGEKEAGKKGFLHKDEFFPDWLWGGAEDRLHGRRRRRKEKVKEVTE
ncbi:MAG: hypothetical protein LQ349_000222 [Xanthoria aureola]|nr:MAG: hypothetical protein LQ349_000222 [Xanthoria aureola]